MIIAIECGPTGQ